MIKILIVVFTLLIPSLAWANSTQSNNATRLDALTIEVSP